MKFGPVRSPSDWHWLVTPAGAGLALVCFFLPWGRFSCTALHKTVSGVGLGGSFWTVFLAILVLLVAGGAAVFLGRYSLARALVVICCVYSFSFLVVKARIMAQGVHTPVGHIRPPGIGAQPHLGGVGFLLGLLLAAGGTSLMTTRPRRGAGGPAMECAPRSNPGPRADRVPGESGP